MVHKMHSQLTHDHGCDSMTASCV